MEIREIREMRFACETFRTYHAGMVEKLTVANRQLALWAATIDSECWTEQVESVAQVAGWGEIARNLYETIETLTGVARISQTPIETLTETVETLSENVETLTETVETLSENVETLTERETHRMSPALVEYREQILQILETIRELGI